MKVNFNSNNFDLIRLIAAAQVAILHSTEHLKIDKGDSFFYEALQLFPGVPIFFFVSGFLISKSYEKSRCLTEYSQNRILRIYPGLILCVLVSFIMIVLSGYLTNSKWQAIDLITWLSGQITFFQFYNPDFLRGYGVGVVNGSLWTISVELQFYILTPLIYKALNSFKAKSNILLLMLACLFMLANRLYFSAHSEYSESTAYKLIGVSFIPWIYMFIIGIIAQRHFNILFKYLHGRALQLLSLYIAVTILTTNFLNLELGNAIHPILFISIAAFIFSIAYSYSRASEMLLRRNDISYGIYIYHMPIVNLMIYLGVMHSVSSLLLAMIATIIFAIFSWKIIEKPSLNLKKHSLISTSNNRK